MPTIQQALKAAISNLSQVSESSQIDAEVLMMHVLTKNRVYLYAHSDTDLNPQEYNKFINLVEQRKLGHPIAYLTQKKEFWSLMLEVSTQTLIPRPETELLVEEALKKITYINNPKILELGTGSGAIAIALAHERPDAQIIATDINPPTLKVAQKNANQLKIKSINFVLSDWFSCIKQEQFFDLIVSNPPYLAANEPELSQGDLIFEPYQALCSGPNGTEAFSNIIPAAYNALKPSAWLMIEHGWQQKLVIQNLFMQSGFYRIITYKDLQAHDRLTIGQKNP